MKRIKNIFSYTVLFVCIGFYSNVSAADKSIVSSIQTADAASLYLESGTYDMSLKVWLKEGTSVKTIYTYIQEPWLTVEWDLSNVAKGAWVELKQEIELVEATNNAKFSINVSNDINNLGSEAGALYVDDIYMLKTGETSVGDVSSEFEYSIFPNPCRNYINIKAPDGSVVQLYSMSGKLIKNTIVESSTHSLMVNNLPNGIYIVKINSNDRSVSQRVMID